jgi:hypothetical protein
VTAHIDFSIPEITELLDFLTEDERKELFAILEQDRASMMWRPLPGPQSMAYHSDADVLGYGGAAGGGKTDLMLGSAINRHSISYILRREATQMQGIYNRMTQIMGGQDGFNKSDKIWRFPDGRMVRFGSTPNLGDEMNYQGQARDLLGIDEAANFLQQMIIFLMGWVRTVDPNQRTQTILTFNPPTSAEGRWIVDYFAPWLDDTYPFPALPGEKRWFAMVEGRDVEVPDGRAFVVDRAGGWDYEFDPIEFGGVRSVEVIQPQTRTFVPSRISDNPFLVRTNYMSQLQAMPEPLRSQMLYGDFKAGMTDDPWQVIPTKWVQDAQARWAKREPKPEITSLGVDVARGGEDQSVIAGCTPDLWFDELKEYPGSETPNGPELAGRVIADNRSHGVIHIEINGVGASPYDFLVAANQQVIGVDVSTKPTAHDRSGRLSFSNMRSQLWWQFRELLDPANNLYPALPPGRDLLVELTAPKWTLKGSTIYVESREEIVKRIGRSPDRATAIIIAAIRTPKFNSLDRSGGTPAQQRRNYDPLAGVREHAASRRGYSPLGG